MGWGLSTVGSLPFMQEYWVHFPAPETQTETESTKFSFAITKSQKPQNW